MMDNASVVKIDEVKLSQCEIVREPLRSFEQAMIYADDLVEIAKRQKGPGRRTAERALNRAIVVMTVAAWQVLLEELTKIALIEIEKLSADEPEGIVHRALYHSIASSANAAIGRFNTPNAHNAKQLLATVGIEADLRWEISFGSQKLDKAATEKEINCWLDVRHKIAHGSPTLPDNKVLCKTVNGPTLRRSEAERCMRFFRRVSLETALEVDERLCDLASS